MELRTMLPLKVNTFENWEDMMNERKYGTEESR